MHAVGDNGAVYKAALENNQTEFCDPINAEDCRSPWTIPPTNFSKMDIATCKLQDLSRKTHNSDFSANDLNFCVFFNDNTGVAGGRLGEVGQFKLGKKGELT